MRRRKNHPIKRRITTAEVRAVAGGKISLLDAVVAPPRKFNPTPPRDIVKVKRIADKLIGTTGSTEMEDALNDLSREELRVLDALAFKCVRCEWWFAAHERVTVNDEWMCDACADDARRE